MANIIFSYEFLQNNPYGTYVTGDVIDVYITEASIVNNDNPTVIQTAGVTAFLNSVEIFSGPLIELFPTTVSIKISGAQYCKGTRLVTFTKHAVWPYGYYNTWPGAQECATNPVVCDLIVLGNPETTDPTTDTSSDGEIIVNASSSNPIEYKLNEDFVYGSGQTSNTFSGLSVGGYRIYLRDSYNCGADVYVELKGVGDYAEKFYLSYFDFAGNETKVDILERDYVGAVSEYKGTENPVTLQFNGSGADKFKALLPGNINLGLISETNQQYIDLYTNDPDKYRVKYYKNNSLKFVGKLIPFVYSEDYGATPYPLNVTAVDGLAELSDIDFVQDDGLRLYGSVKLIKIIAHCLKFTRLGLNIRVACNMYASGMSAGASDDPLDQAYVDMEAFYLSQEDTKISFVLESILEPFGARLVQWDGVWNIVRVEEMLASYTYRTFDSAGDYVSNSSFNPVLNLDFPELGDVEFTGIPNLEIQNAYGRITVKYDLGLKPNFLYNGDFRVVSRYNPKTYKYEPVINIDGWVLNSPNYNLYQAHEVTFSSVDKRSVALVIRSNGSDYGTFADVGTAYLKSDAYNVKMGVTNSVLVKVRYKIILPIWVKLPYVKLRMKVQYGSLYLTGFTDSFGGQSWSSTDNTITFFITSTGEYTESEIIATRPSSGTPASGMDFIVSVYHAHPYYADFTSTTDLKALTTTSLEIGYKTEVRMNNAIPRLTMYYYELEETTAQERADIGTSEGVVYAAGDVYGDNNDIVVPNDYNESTNQVHWVLRETGYIDDGQEYPFSIDSISATFLTLGEEPTKGIIRSVLGEKRNKLDYEKTLIIGSDATEITTQSGLFFDYEKILWPAGAISWDTITLSNLSSDLIYSGWLRNASGVAWDLWTRDGVGESEKLHGIWLKSFAKQYNRSWRLLRCSVVSRTDMIGFLNSFKEVNDSNRMYIPISMGLDDKNNIAQCELLELIGEAVTPFVGSAFTTGFGADYN